MILAEAGERIEAIANILPDSPSVSSQRNKSLNMQGKWNRSVVGRGVGLKVGPA